MNNKRYSILLYFIISVIGVTLITQVYWNFKNYQAGKQQLINEVQSSLDQAVDTYYEIKAAQNTVGFIGNQLPNSDAISDKLEQYGLKLGNGDLSKQNTVTISDSLEDAGFLSITGANDAQIDSILKKKKEEYEQVDQWKTNAFNKEKKIDTTTNLFRLLTKNSPDSTRQQAIENLTSKIVISFRDDLLNIEELDSLIIQEFERKNIDGIKRKLAYSNDGNFSGLEESAKLADSSAQRVKVEDYDLYVVSNSKLLPKKSVLKLGFSNVASLVLQRNLVGIGISFLLLSAVIACLLYLLKIIQEQKKLAEIRNDFISNITHEFKTPIATIGVALEGLQHFNQNNDPEKTTKYLAHSKDQLNKLNLMVEKILETATLDKESLELDRSPVELNELLQRLLTKHRQNNPEVTFKFISKVNNIHASIDPFHFENAIDNLLDNAAKYGMPPVEIKLSKAKDQLLFEIKDDGKSLTRDQANRLFEKFYRVPKGNQHDIKGFGIGLYYTRVIIEKHGGSINVGTEPTTNFVIRLPYGKN